MGMMDEMKDKAKGMTDEPDNKSKIEQMAKDKGISMEEAKAKFRGNEPQNP